MSGIRPRPLPHAARRMPAALGAGVLAVGVTLGVTAAAASPSMALPSGAATLAAVSHPAAAVTELNQSRVEQAVSRSLTRTGIAAAASARAEAKVERTARSEAQRADAIATERAAQKAARAKARKLAAQKAAAKKAAAALAAAQADPQAAARQVMGEFGFGANQWSCLQQLWTGESGWQHTATNSSSGAYGIPQALPASKMASAGADWRTNPVTQIRWGLGYIKASYGSPCAALSFWQSNYPHWY